MSDAQYVPTGFKQTIICVCCQVILSSLDIREGAIEYDIIQSKLIL